MPPSTGSPWSSREPRGRPGCRPTRCCTGRSRRGPAGGADRREKGNGWAPAPRSRRCGLAGDSAPGRVVLIREPGSRKAYDLGLFTLDTSTDAAAAAERYSWRWAIEPSNATGKQLTGAGDACNRTRKAVERTVPFAFLVQSLLILWYARCADSPADIIRRHVRCPWYRTKTTPSPVDMHTALRRELLTARISAIPPGQREPGQINDNAQTCDTAAALPGNTRQR